VRTANALLSLPKIAAAMERGQLSYAKVRALTRAACENTENTLLEYALHGTAAHVERIVRDFRRCKEAEELSRDAQQQANRKLTWFYDADGMLVIKARLPPESGQLFIKAIEAAREEVSSAEISAETSNVKFLPEPSARKADALAIIAESFLAQGAAALKGCDRHQIVIHVDAETLRDSTAGRCNFEHGPSVAAETSRRLSFPKLPARWQHPAAAESAVAFHPCDAREHESCEHAGRLSCDSCVSHGPYCTQGDLTTIADERFQRGTQRIRLGRRRYGSPNQVETNTPHCPPCTFTTCPWGDR